MTTDFDGFEAKMFGFFKLVIMEDKFMIGNC